MKHIATDVFFLEDIFEEGWKTFRAIFAKCAPIVLAFGFLKSLLVVAAVDKIPARELAARMAQAASKAGNTMNEAELSELADKIIIRATGLADNVFTFLVFSVATLAVIKLAERAITQQPVETGEAVAEAIRRWPRYLWTSFLGGLIIVGLCFLFLVPGFIWSVYYLFMPYVVAVTSLSGKKGLDYSKSLVRGAFWRTFGYFFAIGLAASIPTLILTLCMGTVENLASGALSGNQALWLAFRSVLGAIPLLVSVFSLPLGTVFFLNSAYRARGR